MIFGSSKEKLPEKQHYAMNLGLTEPAQSSVIEFLIVGKNDANSQNRVIDFFSAHGANLVTHHGYADGATQEFVLSCCIDVSKLDCTIDELLIRLRKMKFVKKVERRDMKGQLYTQFLFPTTLLGLHRVASLDVDSIAFIEDGMRDDDPRKISKLFFDEGRGCSLRVGTKLKDLSDSGSYAPLPDLMKSYLMAAGWGMFEFRMDGEFAFVTIAEPPVHGSGDSVSGVSFISGLAAGAVEKLTGNKMHFRYSNYEKDRKLLTLCLGKSELATVVAGDVRETKAGEESLLEFDSSTTSNFLSEFRQLITPEKVLKAAKRGSLKVGLMNAAKLSHSDANSLLNELVKKGLLEIRKESNVGMTMYFTTQRGDEFVELCGRINDILLDAPQIRVARHQTLTDE